MPSTLPRHAYTDATWFAREMSAIFGSMWVAVARSQEAAAVGDFVRVEIAGASLLVVRAADGALRGFHNVCRHRGTRLTDADAGSFRGRIQCPYHAWTYGFDGCLLAAPHMEGVDGFARADYPLRSVGCDEWDGHVFVCLSHSPSPLGAQLGDLPTRFAAWGMSQLRAVHRVVYDVQANWKLIVQNYNECLHCPVIHPLLNQMHHYMSADNVPTTGTYCGGAMPLKTGVDTLSVDGQRRRLLLPGLPPDDHRRVHYYAVYPNLLLTLHPDYMTTVTLWPLAADLTRLVAVWHFHPEEIARPGFVYGDAVEFWDRTNREDWAISEQSQRGIASAGYVPGPYSSREVQLWEFDRFVLEKLGAAAPVA